MVVPVFSHPSAGLTICDTWDVRIVTVKCWNRVPLSSAMNTESSLPLAILISLPPTPGWESPKYLFTTILSRVSHIFCQKLSNFYILRYIGHHSLFSGLPVCAGCIFLRRIASEHFSSARHSAVATLLNPLYHLPLYTLGLLIEKFIQLRDIRNVIKFQN